MLWLLMILLKVVSNAAEWQPFTMFRREIFKMSKFLRYSVHANFNYSTLLTQDNRFSKCDICSSIKEGSERTMNPSVRSWLVLVRRDHGEAHDTAAVSNHTVKTGIISWFNMVYSRCITV